MPTAPADSARLLQAVLRRVKRRLRAVELLSAGLLLATVLLIELVGLVLGDHLVQGGLAESVRRAGRWALAVSAASTLLLAVVLPLRRRLSDLHVARLLERSCPRLRNDLTTAVELARQGQAHPGVLSAVRHRAARDLAEVDVRLAVPIRRLRRLVAALLTALAGWMFVAAVSPKSMTVSVARILGQPLAAPTATTIDAFSPDRDLTILLGDEVAFEADVTRPRGPVRVALLAGPDVDARLAAARWTDLAPAGEPGRPGLFRRTWDSRAVGAGAWWFQLRAGDAATTPRKLQILPAPTVMQAELSVRWPQYTGRGLTRVQGRRVQALVGSELLVAVRTNVPARQPRLVAEAAAALAMTADANDPTRIAVAMPITGSARVHVRFQDEWGHESVGKVVYQVEAFTDAPPRVVRHDVSQTIVLAPGQELSLSGEASDDLGLAEVSLETRGGVDRGEHVLARLGPPGRTVMPISRGIVAAELGKPGQRLLCRLTARDFRPPEGQVGTAEWFTVILADRPPDQPAQTQPDQPADANAAPGEPDAAPDDANAPASEADAVQDNANAPPERQLDQPVEPQEQARPDAPEPGEDDEQSATPDANAPPASDANAPAPADAEESADADGNQASSAGANQPAADADEAELANAEAERQAQRLVSELERMAGQDQALLQKIAEHLRQGRSADAPHAPPASAGAGAPEPGSAGAPSSPVEGDTRPARRDPSTGQPGPPARGQPDAGAPHAQPSDWPATPQPGPGQTPGPTRGPDADKPTDQGQAPRSAGPADQAKGQGQGKAGQEGEVQGQGQGQGQVQAQGPGSGGGEGPRGPGAPPTGEQLGQPGQPGLESLGRPGGLPAALESLGRLIDEAQRDRRAGTLPEALLRELNMTDPEFQAFLARYTDRFDRLRQARGRRGGLERVGQPMRPPGSLEVRRGAADPRGLTGTGQTRTDPLGGLAAPARQQVAEPYRRHVEDFFRAVSETAPAERN